MSRLRKRETPSTPTRSAPAPNEITSGPEQNDLATSVRRVRGWPKRTRPAPAGRIREMDEEPVEYMKLFIVGVVLLAMAYVAYLVVARAWSWHSPGL